MNHIIVKLLCLFLLGYRRGLSPWLPAACRYYPTCSAYAEEAIKKHGVRKGVILSLRRVARCHPRSAGGYDPVV